MAAPQTIVAGDSASWAICAPGHRASDGWGRVFVLAGPSSFNGAVSDDDQVKLTSAQSAALTPGRYSGTVVATRGDERKTLERFEVVVTPDPLTQTEPLDMRTHARRTLEAIEAVLEKRATKGQDEMAIGGRRIKNTPIADLLVLRDRYAAIVSREEAGGGELFGQKIYTRWG